MGTPVGCDQFVQEVVEKAKFWQGSALDPRSPVSLCAGPRCHHAIRTLPPSQSIEYARRHDEGMEQTMGALLGGLPGEQRAKNEAQQFATLPKRMGGLGLRSADAWPMEHTGLLGRTLWK